jgi:anti-sigma factor RsiW
MGEDPNDSDWLAPASPARPLSSRRIKTIGLVAAGVVAGGVLAGTLGASAATSSSGTSGTPSRESSAGSSSATKPPANAHGSTPVRSDEKSVSAAITAELTQKALAKVPGGKVYRVETDAGDAAYEAHMTKADGTEVTVKFDNNLNVTAVETGMGNGDPMNGGPAGAHGPGGPSGPGGPGGPGGRGDHDGDGPEAPAAGTTTG